MPGLLGTLGLGPTETTAKKANTMDMSGLHEPTKKYPQKYPPKTAGKRRSKSKQHPGVVLLKPSGKHSWRARFTDPLSGRSRKVTLHPIDAVTAEARLAWAIAMSESIQQTLRDRALGVRAPTNVTVQAAIERWLEADDRALGTEQHYQLSAERLAEYVGTQRYTHELSADMLSRFRAHLHKLPAERGPRKGETRSTVTVNHDLRVCAAFLRWARVNAGATVTRDQIAETLKQFRVKHERKAFLDPGSIAVLLKLARRTEPAECYAAILCLLLTGMRLREMLKLDWAWVDDGDRIRLPAHVIKTRTPRDVDLTVTATALPQRPANISSGRVFTVSAETLYESFSRLQKSDPRLANVNAQMLRRTAATYFTNAFNPWRSAKSLGHSVLIAEKHYAGLVRVAPGCATLEQSMGILELLPYNASVTPLRRLRKVPAARSGRSPKVA